MSPNRPRVLIVDDEPHICHLISEELSDRGFDCCTTTKGRQAELWLGEKPFDLLIADITMPEVGGLDLLAHVSRCAPSCKVILVTGISDRNRITHAIMLGAYDYVEKPFQLDELSEIALRAVSNGAGLSPLSVRAAEAMETTTQARQACLDSVQALVRAVEAKDPYTRRHSEQVRHYAMHFARAMGLPKATLESVHVAAILHDIGKIGVPDYVLTKTGPLVDEEFEYIRRHPSLGADILSNITLFRDEANFVRHHHERWDGGGYPDGLAGEETPLIARIINVADCVDAMLMERTYKKGYPVEKMLGELTRCSGTQFDHRVANVAIQWCRRNPDKIILPNQAMRVAS